MSAVRINFDDKAFQRSLKRFLKLNKRDNGPLIEKQARKVCLGVMGVRGIKQLAWDKRAKPSKIRQDMKPLLAGWYHAGGRNPKKMVKFKGRAFKGLKAMVLKSRQKKSGWISKICAIRGWSIPRAPRTAKLKSAMSGAKIKVIIRTTGGNPTVIWESRNTGFNSMNKKYNMTGKALRNGTRDMDEYIARKIQTQWRKS